jgi:hypothetical protein
MLRRCGPDPAIAKAAASTRCGMSGHCQYLALSIFVQAGAADRLINADGRDVILDAR